MRKQVREVVGLIRYYLASRMIGVVCSRRLLGMQATMVCQEAGERARTSCTVVPLGPLGGSPGDKPCGSICHGVPKTHLVLKE